MHAFEYEAPLTLDEAVQRLARSGADARPLAGGTDLIDQMRIGKLTPQLLVDVKKIAELNRLEHSADGLHIGAAVPCHRIYGDRGLDRDYSALADSCRIIGSIQIQNRASVGGNLCNSGPAADTTPSLIALEATCILVGPAGRREIPAHQFCTGPGKNVLQAGELLVEFHLPPPRPASGSHYRRVIHRTEMDIAVVGVGASVQLDSSRQTILAARIGLGAVAPTPLWATAAGDAIAGAPIGESTYRRAAEAACDIIAPITDMRGPREYRLHATGVLVRRVLQMAVARARGETIAYRPGYV